MGFDGSLRQRSSAVQRQPFGGGFRQMQHPPGQQPQQPGVIAPPMMHMPPGAPVPNQLPYMAQQQPIGSQSSHGGVNNIPTIDSTKNGTAAIGEVPPEEPAHHMEVEEEKEPKEPTLAERVSTLRENSIGFDVIFHVGPSNNPKIVQAHRAILAAGSKVLSNTFFNSDVSTPPSKKPKPGSASNSGKLVLEYPDVNPVAFDTVIDYLYSDFEPKAININESAVLDTLYAARKFEIPQLEKACIVLLGDISPSVAVALIEQADKHRSKQLIEKCFEVIDAETDGALSADSLTRLTKESLKRVVERSQLSPSDEIMIFRAVCAWAEAECARQGDNSPTPQKKRQVLGDVFNAVRFPTMSVEEFGEVANSGMLTDGEIGLLFRYISSTVHPKLDLPFSQVERRCLGRSKQVVKRYLTLSKNPCKKTRSSIWFIVNREILVTALGVYGFIHASESDSEATKWETTLDIELECAEPGHRMKEHATVTIAGLYGDMRPVVARFKRPTRISPNVPHRASIQFKEDVETYAGANGAEDIRVHIGQGGVGGAQETSSGADGDMFAAAATDPSSIVHFAFHNDDPNGIRRGMTRGPAVFTNAIGGFYNRPQQYRPVPSISEGCLYEGQIPEIHFLAPALPKPEAAAATTTTTIKTD